MSTSIDPRRSIAAWLEAEVPDRAPARLIDASRERISTTRQRPVWWPAGRTFEMHTSMKVVIAAVAVVVVAIAGYNLQPGRSNVGGSPPSAAPSPSASPTVVSGGALAPGRYAATVKDTSVKVEFTVPAGWRWDADAGFMTKTQEDGPTGHFIALWSGHFQVYTDPCHWEKALPAPPTGPTAKDVVTALAAQPLRNASAPVERKASASGGAAASSWSGWTVKTTVPADADFSTCDKGQFRSWGPENLYLEHQGPGQRNTVWAIDTPSGDEIAIVVGSFAGVPAQTMHEIDGILDSMTFHEGV